LLWIALPAVVLAGDCPDDRGWYCAKTWMTALPLLAAGAGTLLAAMALSRALGPPPEPPEEMDSSQDDAVDKLERPSVPPEQSADYNPFG
jgi:hypothetical protein